MSEQQTAAQSADDLVAEADTGARNPSAAWQANLIIGTCIVWSLFQLYIASKVPGVLAVLTAADLEPLGLHWMPTLAGDKQMVLADGKVLYQGQEVAFVVAEDRYAAADGIEAVEVDYEERISVRWQICHKRLDVYIFPPCPRFHALF